MDSLGASDARPDRLHRPDDRQHARRIESDRRQPEDRHLAHGEIPSSRLLERGAADCDLPSGGPARLLHCAESRYGTSAILAFEMPFNEETRISESFMGWREKELHEIVGWIRTFIASIGRTITFDKELKME